MYMYIHVHVGSDKKAVSDKPPDKEDEVVGTCIYCTCTCTCVYIHVQHKKYTSIHCTRHLDAQPVPASKCLVFLSCFLFVCVCLAFHVLF